MSDYQPYAAPQANVSGPSAAPQGIPDAVLHELVRTGPWVRLLATLGYLGVFFIFIAAIGLMAGGSAMAGEMGIPPDAAVAVGGGYLLSGVLMLIMIRYLGRYGSKIRSLSTTRSMGDLVDALSAQASYWKFIGVLATIYLVLMGLGIVAAIVIPIILST